MYTKKNPNGDIKQPTSGTFSQLEKKGVVLHGPFTNVFFRGYGVVFINNNGLHQPNHQHKHA